MIDKVLPTGTKDQNTYNTILKAIAHRKKTNKEIADYIGKTPNYVATYLTKLVSNEVIEKKESFNKSQKLVMFDNGTKSDLISTRFKKELI